VDVVNIRSSKLITLLPPKTPDNLNQKNRAVILISDDGKNTNLILYRTDKNSAMMRDIEKFLKSFKPNKDFISPTFGTYLRIGLTVITGGLLLSLLLSSTQSRWPFAMVVATVSPTTAFLWAFMIAGLCVLCVTENPFTVPPLDETLAKVRELAQNFDPQIRHQSKEIYLSHSMETPLEKNPLLRPLLEFAHKVSDWRKGWIVNSPFYKALQGHPVYLYSMEGRISAASPTEIRQRNRKNPRWGFDRITTAQGGLVIFSAGGYQRSHAWVL